MKDSVILMVIEYDWAWVCFDGYGAVVDFDRLV